MTQGLLGEYADVHAPHHHRYPSPAELRRDLIGPGGHRCLSSYPDEVRLFIEVYTFIGLVDDSHLAIGWGYCGHTGEIKEAETEEEGLFLFPLPLRRYKEDFHIRYNLQKMLDFYYIAGEEESSMGKGIM
jgi:hypothetical protein